MSNQFISTLKNNKTLIGQILLVVIFIGTLAWGTSIAPPPIEEPLLEGSVTITPIVSTPLAGTTPVEFTPNQNETEGIIFAGVLLVLIIVVGTLGVIKQKD